MTPPTVQLREVQQNLLEVVLRIRKLLKEGRSWPGKIGLAISHRFLDQDEEDCGGTVEIISVIDLTHHSLSLNCQECGKVFMIDLKDIGLEEVLSTSTG